MFNVGKAKITKEKLETAKAIARTNGYFITEKVKAIGGSDYLVFRQGDRANHFVAKRNNASAVLGLIRQITKKD